MTKSPPSDRAAKRGNVIGGRGSRRRVLAVEKVSGQRSGARRCREVRFRGEGRGLIRAPRSLGRPVLNEAVRLADGCGETAQCPLRQGVPDRGGPYAREASGPTLHTGPYSCPRHGTSTGGTGTSNTLLSSQTTHPVVGSQSVTRIANDRPAEPSSRATPLASVGSRSAVRPQSVVPQNELPELMSVWTEPREAVLIVC